jgi:hypothetical protein
MKKDQYLNFKKMYHLFEEIFKKGEKINADEILEITGWKKSTFDTYYNKKLKGNILEKNSDGKNYNVINIERYDEESFLRLMSQNQNKSEKPFKKELKYEAEQFLNKAIESAYLAVDIYNRPQTRFRTDGYIVMMIIAWTSLFHTIFEEDGIDYFYKDENGDDIIIGVDKKTWELSECIKSTTYIDEAIKTNLRFMIELRNKIEHRFVPELDILVCGENQAMLLNFEELLVERFGSGYSLSANLAIPLQLVKFKTDEKEKALEKFQSSNFENIKEYICNFRNALSEEIYNDMHYSFKVFLVPKLKSHLNRGDLAMEFLHQNDIENNDYDEMMKSITLIKEKTVQVANQGKYKPSKVCEIVTNKSKKEFKIHQHTNAWKYFDVRKKGYQASGCKTQYCQFDPVHEDYIYTQEWIDFLVDILLDDKIYDAIVNYKD